MVKGCVENGVLIKLFFVSLSMENSVKEKLFIISHFISSKFNSNISDMSGTLEGVGQKISLYTINIKLTTNDFRINQDACTLIESMGFAKKYISEFDDNFGDDFEIVGKTPKVSRDFLMRGTIESCREKILAINLN
jgi:hypothetical protein